MFDPDKKAQYAKEADGVAVFHEAHGIDDIGRHEKVESHVREAYQPPSFIKDTAGCGLYEQLRELLLEVRDINEMFVGLSCREVEAYLSVTGQCDELTQRIQGWVSAYFELRLTRDDPKDGGDSLRKCGRLNTELDRILRGFCRQRNAINFVMLSGPILYGSWLLYRRTWRKHIIFSSDRFWMNSEFSSPHAGTAMAEMIASTGWEAQCLQRFTTACELPAGSDDACLSEPNNVARLRASVQQHMHLIHGMRPFLLDTRPERLRILLPSGKWVAWRWSVGLVLANLIFCSDERATFLPLESLGQGLIVGVNYDGQIAENCLHWITGFTPHIDMAIIRINAWLLEAFFTHLCGLYDQIDFDAIRAARQRKLVDEEFTETDLALINSDLDASQAEQDEPPAVEEQRTKLRYRPREIRLPVLLRILERSFDCEVGQGKGSEWTAYRHGERKFIFGSHGRVSAVTVGMALQRLGISKRDWGQLADN